MNAPHGFHCPERDDHADHAPWPGWAAGTVRVLGDHGQHAGKDREENRDE